jgi:hypothetical protein
MREKQIAAIEKRLERLLDRNAILGLGLCAPPPLVIQKNADGMEEVVWNRNGVDRPRVPQVVKRLRGVSMDDL